MRRARPALRRSAFTLALACYIAPLGVAAGADAGEPEEVETVETVETVVPMLRPTAAKEGVLALVGKLHPVLVHFPIAWLLLLALVDGLALVLRRERWARPGVWLLGLAVLSAVPAVVTGLLRGARSQDPALIQGVLEHRNLALLTLAVATAALVLRLLRRNRLEGAWRVLYLALIVGAVGLIIATGHHGGALVFGENYLPF